MTAWLGLALGLVGVLVLCAIVERIGSAARALERIAAALERDERRRNVEVGPAPPAEWADR